MLTTEQTNAIAGFCEDRGVKYYDVQLELVDHMSEWIEHEQAANQVSFDEAFARMKQSFIAEDFRDMVRSQARTVAGLLKRNLFSSFMSFFSWPKIAITFLLVTAIVFFDQYAGADKFPAIALHVFNLLNLSMPFGHKLMFNEYKYAKFRRLVSVKEINRINFYFLLPGILYLFFLISYHEKILFSPIVYKISIYIFPFVVLLSFAWKNAAIAANEKIRGNYPGAFRLK
jgi:hypothetical protein